MARGRRTQYLILVDHQQLFRRGLRTLLSACDDMIIMGEAATLDELLLRVPASGADTIVMDVALLVDASEEQIRAVRQMQSKASILFLTAEDRPELLDLALRAGGDGYMLKGSSPTELLNGIRKIGSPEIPNPTTATADLKALAASGKFARSAPLTTREQEIVRLLAEGRTVRETAAELHLSIKTVEAHKLNLMRKLNIHTRATLIEYAIEKGLVQPLAA